MTFFQIEALVDYHEEVAANFSKMADGLGDCPAANDSRDRVVVHKEIATQLRALVAPEAVTSMSLDELRQGAVMTAKVIMAMERERRDLCAEIAALKLGQMKA